MATVRIKYVQLGGIPGDVIPYIDIPDPIRPSERFVPDLIPEEEGFFFEMSDVHARRILAMDPEHYKLWSPATLRVSMPGSHGGMEIVELTSIDPKCKPVDPIVQKLAENKAAGNVAASKAGKGGKAGKASAPAPSPAPAASSDPLDGLGDITGPEE